MITTIVMIIIFIALVSVLASIPGYILTSGNLTDRLMSSKRFKIGDYLKDERGYILQVMGYWDKESENFKKRDYKVYDFQTHSSYYVSRMTINRGFKRIDKERAMVEVI